VGAPLPRHHRKHPPTTKVIFYLVVFLLRVGGRQRAFVVNRLRALEYCFFVQFQTTIHILITVAGPYQCRLHIIFNTYFYIYLFSFPSNINLQPLFIKKNYFVTPTAVYILNTHKCRQEKKNVRG